MNIINNPLSSCEIKSWKVIKINYYTIILKLTTENVAKINDIVLKWTRRNKKSDEIDIYEKLKNEPSIVKMYAGGYGQFKLHDLIPSLNATQEANLIAEINRTDGKKILNNRGSWLDLPTKKDQVALFLEAMDGNLEGFFKKIEEPHKSELLTRVIDVVQNAFAALDRIDVYHNDPTPRNLFYRFTEENIVFKLGDFGSARSLDQTNCSRPSETALLQQRLLTDYRARIDNKRRSCRSSLNPKSPNKINEKLKKRKLNAVIENLPENNL